MQSMRIEYEKCETIDPSRKFFDHDRRSTEDRQDMFESNIYLYCTIYILTFNIMMVQYIVLQTKRRGGTCR